MARAKAKAEVQPAPAAEPVQRSQHVLMPLAHEVPRVHDEASAHLAGALRSDEEHHLESLLKQASARMILLPSGGVVPVAD